jgi:ABC-type sugar transport system ATPase subunit
VILSIPPLLFRHGRTTAILGPNGAGKTTLLRVIAGLERAEAGRIVAGGHDVGPTYRQDIAYVFQEHVFLRQSVRENLALGLKLRKIRPDERRERIQEAARLLSIEHLLDRRADHLSGGEGRRAGIARALCLRSPLMLLDEPLSGLDPATYARLLDELPRLVRASGAASIIVTHNYLEALRLADDLVVLVEGRVRASGDKTAVFLQPADAVVAELLGYVVLRVGGRCVAVRPDAIYPGPGQVEFTVDVEHVFDLVERQAIVGSSEGGRVHITLPPGMARPQHGDRMLMHADRVCELPDG